MPLLIYPIIGGVGFVAGLLTGDSLAKWLKIAAVAGGGLYVYHKLKEV